MSQHKIIGGILNFRGIIYAPTNEQGVVVLFSKVLVDLGFKIETIGTEYPDCVALKKIRNGYKRVNVEFEYVSKNFLAHRHPIEECDVIVCWDHDWDDYPKDKVEIICLKDRIKELKQMEIKAEIGGDGIDPEEQEERDIRDFFDRWNVPTEIRGFFYLINNEIKKIHESVWLKVAETALTYNSSKRVFVYMVPQKKALLLTMPLDPSESELLYERGGWPGLKIQSEEEIEPALDLIKKSFEK